jgi:hypothetical protein
MTMRSTLRGIGLLPVLVSLAAALPVAAMDCPAPPVQSHKDWDVQVRADVGRIGFVRGAQLDTRVQAVTQDLLGKLPGADRVYLEQMMFSAYCTSLRDDLHMEGAEKSRQILAYRKALSTALTPVKR